jgi:hypothetical protein
MLTYEEFKEFVLENFVGCLSGKYQKGILIDQKVLNENATRDSIRIELPTDSGAISISPTIFIDTMYQQYLEIEDAHYVVHKIAHWYEETLSKEQAPDTSHFMNKEYILNNVQIKLISTENNKEYLANLPNRSFEDLSIIYYCNVDKEQGMIFKIKKNTCELLGIEETELYEHAYENTKLDSGRNVEELADMVADVNETLEEGDKLSNQVYGYKKGSLEIKKVTNRDGLFVQQSMAYKLGR